MIKIQKTVLASIIALMSGQLSAADSYDVIDLGELNDNPVFVLGLNNSDIAVGYSYFISENLGNQPVHGFAFQNNAVTDLGSIANENTDLSIIFGISNNDLAVGTSLEQYLVLDADGNPVDDDNDGIDDYRSYERAIYTTVGSDTINLVPKFVDEEKNDMRAVAANNSGVVVGWGLYNPTDDLNSDGEPVTTLLERPFIYDTVSNTLTRLDPLNYNQQFIKAALRDINDNGIAIGWSGAIVEKGNYLRSFYVDVNAPTNLIDMKTSEDKSSSAPFAINNSNKIVGKRQITSSDNFSAYVFDAGSQTFIDIPPVKVGLDAERTAGAIYIYDNSIAYDINNHDQIVGTAIYDVVPNTYHAFLYQNEKTIDLNTLIDCKIDPNAVAEGEPDWHLIDARAINDNGVIVGNGLLNSVPHAFMLKIREGVVAKTCQDVEEDSSGSGSFPLWLLVLLGGGAGIKRRLKV